MSAFRTGHFRLGVPLLVDPPVKVLQEGEVGGEQVLDQQRVDALGRAEPDNRASEQQHREIGRIAVHPRVGLRGDLVPRGRQAHHALPVHGARLVDVAARQHERVLGEQSGSRSGGLLPGEHGGSLAGHQVLHSHRIDSSGPFSQAVRQVTHTGLSYRAR